MNALDAYNIINKVKQVFPKKYHRPYEIVFTDTDITKKHYEEVNYPINWASSPYTGIIGLARRRYKDVTIHLPNLIKMADTDLTNGTSGYKFPVKTREEFVAYVYLHECGHLVTPKQINQTEVIADKFATYWFNKLKEKLW